MAFNHNELILHCGGVKVDREDLDMHGLPKAATATHFPVLHGTVVKTLLQQLQYQDDMEIVREEYGLHKDGAQMFGLLTMLPRVATRWQAWNPANQETRIARARDQKDYAICIGIRNSHDRSFPAAIALGSRVFVCDNLSLTGEIKIARRHTRFIHRDLPVVVSHRS